MHESVTRVGISGQLGSVEPRVFRALMSRSLLSTGSSTVSEAQLEHQRVLDREMATEAITRMLHTDPSAIDNIVALVAKEEERAMSADVVTIKSHIAALERVRDEIQPTTAAINANADAEVKKVRACFAGYDAVIKEREEELIREIRVIELEKLAVVREQTARIGARIDAMAPGVAVAERALVKNAFGKDHDPALRAEATRYLKKATVPFNTAVEVVADIQFRPTNREPLEAVIRAIGDVRAGVVGVVNIVECLPGVGQVTLAWEPASVVASDTSAGGGVVLGYELEMSVPPSSGQVASIIGNDQYSSTLARNVAASATAGGVDTSQRSWRRVYRGREPRFCIKGAPSDAAFRVRAFSKAGFSPWSTETPVARQPVDLVYNFDGDTNGVLHWLGTKGNTARWSNPHDISVVRAHASSVQWGAYDLGQLGECSFMYRYILRVSCSQFDSLPLTYLMNSWPRDERLLDEERAELVGYGRPRRRVPPLPDTLHHCRALRHRLQHAPPLVRRGLRRQRRVVRLRPASRGSVLLPVRVRAHRCERLSSASQPPHRVAVRAPPPLRYHRFTLRRHNFDTALNAAGDIATWELLNTGMSFRYLRIVQYGANSHGNYHLILSHMEWYGKLS